MAEFFVVFWDPAGLAYEAVNGPNANKTFSAIDGADANGLAALNFRKSGKYVSFPASGIQAKLTTALAAANDDLTFIAKAGGTSGNNIRVRYVVAGNNTPLSVSVSVNDITVNVATSGAGAATSTALQIRDAVNQHAGASVLVTAMLATGNDGSGVVAALGFTSLTGGTDNPAVATTTTLETAAESVPTTF